MIITSVFVVLSLLSLLFLIRLAKGHGFGASAIQNAKANIRPVDIRAFRNLVDPSQEEYLRSHLPPEDFKVVHRERLRAAAQYISCAAHNAAILVKMGEAARRSSDPAVVEDIVTWAATLAAWPGRELRAHDGAGLSSGSPAIRWSRHYFARIVI
jgi:hypothetical protein